MESSGRKAIRIANKAVDAAILTAVILLLVSGSYAMWDTNQVYKAADAANYEKYKPAEDGGLSFEELREINPEVFAWLTVYGTHIDYPVAQSEDNMKYVNTNAEGSYALTGSIFLDSASSRDFADFNSILYGHHMEKQTMFGEIELFEDASYFDARKHGDLYYEGKHHGLEFFAFFKADAYDFLVFRAGIKSREEQEAYLDMILGMSIRVRDIGVSADDRIVLLSTCSPNPTNGRDILVGRITDEIYEDAFMDEPPAAASLPATDAASSL